eukprot:3003004-Prorocentrum_lima.AAC.1
MQMYKVLHPPGLGQTRLVLALLCHHGLSYEIEPCPGEIEEITSSLEIDHKFAGVTTLILE